MMPDKYTIKNFSRYHFVEKPPKKLLEQVSNVICLNHYFYKLEKSYINWIKRYILFHDKRHPKEMGSAETEAFLTHLAIEKM
ncbi:MAG: phage integrase N-terminal SAM-like domain-containing protein [Gloeocapsa sp. UFS-A4-WI-NPMV-4B04]|nr:phage integrase N-terminal SAM-like domain-containing protein [Gloeocapsa sp. UFS-A4-WI-NPMV-4B04]